MKIVIYTWNSFCIQDMIDACRSLGHQVQSLPLPQQKLRHDDATESEICQQIQAYMPDFVFTFNYFPILSLACQRINVRYVSWVYDSPYVMLYSYTIANSCNLVFVFDRELYQEFHTAGIETVHYLPMAANPQRLSHSDCRNEFLASALQNQCDIAFVGSLYTEKHQFYQRLEGITPYSRGYLEGIMAAQKQVYGYNFLQELLPSDIINDMQRILPMAPDPRDAVTIEYLYSQYVLSRQVTALERSELLSAIGQHWRYDLYTPDTSVTLPGAVNHGSVDPYHDAPLVYRKARINLNISLRSIKSGIPLRAFEIMGSEGFLLSNYQADFLEYFKPGQDFVFYESKQDLLDKLDYYLSHEEERQAIARSGYQQVLEHHTYQHRIAEIISYL